MTQSVISMFQYLIYWQILFVVIIFSVLLSLILIIFPKYSEDEKPRRKERENKITIQDTLMQLFIDLILLCIIVIFLTIILVIIGNNLSQSMINCANCSIALNGGL